ncbi:MAG: PQQ-binding-like beta-propeller repeat protein [Magnetococcales bacterium]|nr:PQQ-binding-like beta-propeller repeat protein [Magnetococcales bacterium]
MGARRDGGRMGHGGSRIWLSVLLAGMLTGCATPTWLGGKGGEEKETVRFQPPDPGVNTGMRQVWKRSVAGSPDKHFVHPGRLAVSGDSVFVGTFQGQVARVDRKTGDILWKSALGSAVTGGVGLDESRVYAGTEQGVMVALARESGAELWRTRLTTAVDSAPLAVDGKVIFLTLDNRAYALDAATGQRLWMHSTPTEALVVMGSSTPSAADGLAFIGYSSGEVFALRLDDGQRVWSDNLRVLGGSGELDLMQDVDASVVLSEDQGLRVAPRRAFIVNHQGRVMACFAANGRRIWEKRVSAVRQPLWSMGRLFVVDMDGNLIAMGADDGVELWRVRLSDGLLTSPVLYKDQILVADDQRRMFALDPVSGRVMGRETLSGPVLSLPVVTEDGVYWWTNEGDLLRYE